jgi:hypothetical protein
MMHDLQIPRIEINSAEQGPYPDIGYYPGLEDTLPGNIIEIDKSLIGIQNNLNYLNNSWNERVLGLVEAMLKNKPIKPTYLLP